MTVESRSWLPNHWLKCTLPILEDPGLVTEDFQGSSFVIHRDGVNFVITARHVIEDLRNPMIGFHANDRSLQRVSTHDMEAIAGLKWIYHPDGLDLAAIPFQVGTWMDVVSVDEMYWNTSASFSAGDIIAHLGYPEMRSSDYLDGSPAFFAVSMPGKILEIQENSILTQTSGLHGASGGPLFLKPARIRYPSLIGVVIAARINSQGQYLQKTTSIPIQNVLKILEHEKMREQIENFETLSKDIDELQGW